MHITVLITLLNDRRVERTLASVLEQSRAAEAILVADGGSTDGSKEAVAAMVRRHPRIEVASLPGSVARTRNEALPRIRPGIVVFLDADEVAPREWLATLIAPIEAGQADFAGGPTRPLGAGTSRVERYVNDYDEWFYREVVPGDLVMLPMGNSAWRTDLLARIGGVDPRFEWGGEDYDVNLRALKANARGAFVQEAWVWHDQSSVSTLGRLLRKKYRYMVGATVAYRRNGVLGRKARRSSADAARFRHRYNVLLNLLKPFALLKGLREHRRAFRER